jgi:hypothetical protein
MNALMNAKIIEKPGTTPGFYAEKTSKMSAEAPGWEMSPAAHRKLRGSANPCRTAGLGRDHV